MNLRQAAQRALKAMEDGEDWADMIEFSDALIALRAALAEHDRLAGIEAIEKDAGIHVSQQAEPEQEPVECDCSAKNMPFGRCCKARAHGIGEQQ